MTTAEWMTRGLCQVDAYRPYFAERVPARMTRGGQTQAAKDTCKRCPVLAICREWTEAQEGTKPASYRAGVLAARTARERARDAGADTGAADEGIDDEDGAA
jgi:hypothetical protein